MQHAALQWGPLAVNGQLLMLLLAFLAFYFGMRLWLRGKGEEAEFIRDWTGNAGVGALLIWKFAELLMQPSLLTKGFSALMMPGSQRSAWLAIAWVIAYVLWTWRKRSRSTVLLAMDTWTFAAVIGFVVYSGLSLELGRPTDSLIGWEEEGLTARYHPIFLYKAVLGIIIASLLYRWKWQNRGVVFGSGMLAAGAGGMIISFFTMQVEAKTVYAGLALDQWQSVALMLAGMFWLRIALPVLSNNKSGKEMMVMPNNPSNNSKEQEAHEQANKEQRGRDFAMGVDKKLSGPNRPAE